MSLYEEVTALSFYEASLMGQRQGLSQRDYTAWHWQRFEQLTAKQEETGCLVCGKAIHFRSGRGSGRGRHQRLCSNKCFKVRNRRLRSDRRAIARLECTCRYCGMVFTAKLRPGPPPAYCTVEHQRMSQPSRRKAA